MEKNVTVFDPRGLKGNYKLPTLNVANAPVTINPPPGELPTNTSKSEGGSLTGETLSVMVDLATATTNRINAVQLGSMHDTININLNSNTMSINAVPAITTRDMQETNNDTCLSAESSLSLKSGNPSATNGIVAVTAIEAHEPVMEFFILPIPRGTFKHNNPEAVLSFEVRLVNGSSLPSWMSFDAKQKVLSGTPPKDAQGEYQVVLIAKDQFGGEARTLLLFTVV